MTGRDSSKVLSTLVFDDPNEAVAMIEDAMRAWIRVGLEYGDPIPEPLDLGAWIQ